MTFRPTDGLRRAESVIQDILNAYAACGHTPITDPTFRHGAKQIIANALDGFRSGVEAEPEFPLEERDERDFVGIEEARDRVLAMTVPREELMASAPATNGNGGTSAPKKRRRGRPPGKAKKAKAAPKADAVEATAS